MIFRPESCHADVVHPDRLPGFTSMFLWPGFQAREDHASLCVIFLHARKTMWKELYRSSVSGAEVLDHPL